MRLRKGMICMIRYVRCYDKYGMIRMICYARISMVKLRLCMSRYRRLYLLSESSLSYVYAVGKQPDSNG